MRVAWLRSSQANQANVFFYTRIYHLSKTLLKMVKMTIFFR